MVTWTTAAPIRIISPIQFVFEQATRGEVFAESSMRQRVATEHGLPMRVMFDGIRVRRLMLSTVDGQVRLPVTVEAQPSQPHAVGYGFLVDAGQNRPAIHLDFLRLSDVD